MYLLIQDLNQQTAVEFKAWTSNYTPLINLSAIAYPCPNPDAIVSLSSVSKRGPGIMHIFRALLGFVIN